METLEEMVETARVLAGQPLPQGRRLAVVGNAGGAAVLAADTASAMGIDVPEFSTSTEHELLEATGAVNAGNPVDLGTATTPQTIEQAIRVVLNSGEVDAVLVNYAATRAGNVDDTYAALARAAAGATIPILVNCLGAPDADPQVFVADGSKLPVFLFPEAAVRALGHAMQYAEWRARPQGGVPNLDGLDLDGARSAVRRFLADQHEGGWLDQARSEALMGCAGIEVVPAVVAGSWNGVREAGERVGYPLAMKTAAAGIVHKTDVGGVRLGITGNAGLETAYREIIAATGDPNVAVQAMAPSGVELVAGLVRDPLFGPVLMAGSGGVLTDLLADRRWRGLPLTDLDAAEMVRSLRCAPLLAGYRGGEPADEPAVLDVLHRIARLAECLPEIAELDLNPLIAAPSGAFAVDVKIRLAPSQAEPDWYSRHLR
jgi:acyl-CoA synthetase (NDP forming)